MKDLAASINHINEYFKDPKGKITLGIDGIVDEVWQIISSRKNPDEYILFEKMKDFAKSVYDCGEGGYANEILPKRRIYGGFTANTGKAVKRLGGSPVLLGMFGKEGGVDPAFEEFLEEGKLFTVAEAPVCQIFEFADGKLILPYIAERMHFNWETLVDVVSWDGLKEAFTNVDVVGLGYWSSMPHFDEILSKLCEHFLIGQGSRLFFDFADIRKRSREALEHTLYLLAELNEQVPMTLSLNENEAAILYSYMGREFSDDGVKALKDTVYTQQQMGLDELIVHTPHFAVGATANNEAELVKQQRCEAPVITTGAGDNFNGGYLTACVKEDALSLAERLFVGNTVTRFYVRNGYSPDVKDLESEMQLAV